MKKIYTLFIMSLLALTVIGQSEKTRNYHNPFNQNRIQSSENQKEYRPGLDIVRSYANLEKQSAQLKSSRDTKMALDSITSDGEDGVKSIFLYDDYGNNTLHTQYNWYPDMNEWIKYFESEFSYDNNNNITQDVSMFYDEESGMMVGYEKFEYVYDDNKNLTQQKTLRYVDSTATWVNERLTENTYNADGELEESIISIWAENQWAKYTKTEFTNNDEGVLIQSFSYIWENDEWKIWWKDDYTYDGNGNLTLFVISQYFISEWMEALKYEYTYDTDGNMTSESESWYDLMESSWTKLFLTEYVFDNHGNLIELIDTDFDWEEKSKGVFTYNNDYSRNDLLLPYLFVSDFPQLFNHMIPETESFVWDDGSQQWISIGKSMLHYSEHTVSDITSNSITDVQVYPNPASDYVYFELTDNSTSISLEVFDMQGRMVIDQEISGKQQVSVSHLDKGLYVYKMKNDGNLQSGKIMIE